MYEQNNKEKHTMAVLSESVSTCADSTYDSDECERRVPARMPLSAGYSNLSDSDEEDFKYEKSSPKMLSSSPSSLFPSVLSGAVAAFGILAFSLWFPFFLAPQAAGRTYHRAFYQYDASKSHFDNTAWTYVTDYILAIVMAKSVYNIMKDSRKNISDRLCRRSASLLMLYCISVIAGGLAHQFITTLELRNSLYFRFLWIVCVGTVSAASCSMGMSGTEAVRQFQKQPNCSKMLLQLPALNEAFWWTFGICLAAVCAMGGISYQRPACDIFIAGITQTISSFYMMIFFFLVEHKRVTKFARSVGFVGFILNAPLLPMYPLLVQYTNLTLASVNTLLHCWLCVAWSMQGYSLHHLVKALVAEDDAKIQSKKSI